MWLLLVKINHYIVILCIPYIIIIKAIKCFQNIKYIKFYMYVFYIGYNMTISCTYGYYGTWCNNANIKFIWDIKKSSWKHIYYCYINVPLRLIIRHFNEHKSHLRTRIIVSFLMQNSLMLQYICLLFSKIPDEKSSIPTYVCIRVQQNIRGVPVIFWPNS